MKTYKTKDFYLSALLYVNGFKLIDSEFNGINTVYFIFENNDDEKLNQLLTDFINKTVSVNLKSFVHAITIMRYELNKYR